MIRSIGIDLGTTNSCVASIDASGQPRILENRQGARTTPSVVSFAPGGKVLVGAPARRQLLTAPRETLFAVKRLIGRRWDDPEILRLARTLPYSVVAAENGDAWVDVGGQPRSPQEISAYVLDAVRQVAREQLGGAGAIDEAIITVPAHFDAAQRQATKDAAEIGGLRVRRLLNEPTAAALGYGVHKGAPACVAVCDLGGGTFDVSILNAEGGVFEVVATHGDILLGGEDIDRRIVERLAEEIRSAHGIDVLADATLLGRVRDEAERVKHALSEQKDARVEIPYLSTAGGKQLDFVRPIARAELESWVGDLIARLAPPCKGALEQAGISARDVDQVLLVGGMTRMPAVAQAIEGLFGKRAARNANPDEAVAIGAATQCAILDGLLTGVVLLDVTSRAIGVHAGGGRFVPVIPKNATVPTRESRVMATSKDGQRELVVEVYEGEHVDVRQNRPLGVFTLGGLPDGPAGEVVAMVDFTVDVDGILSVSARELASGTRTDVRLAASCGLSRREVRHLAAGRPRT